MKKPNGNMESIEDRFCGNTESDLGEEIQGFPGFCHNNSESSAGKVGTMQALGFGTNVIVSYSSMARI